MSAERGSGGREGSAAGGFAALGLGALVVGCCAGLPLLAALAGSVAIGTVLGVGAGLLALVGLAILVIVRARRRAKCKAPGSGADSLGVKRGTRREVI